MFGVVFPADKVLSQVRARKTAFPLPALPANLGYRDVEIVPEGLRIALSGKNVLLKKGQLTGGATC
jgi:hypothetical protein